MSEHIHRILPVMGMSCAGCAANVERVVSQQKGVVRASVNFANSSLSVEYISGEITLEKLRTVIQSAGYNLVIEQDQEGSDALKMQIQEKHYRQLKRNTIGAAILAVPLVVLGMFLMHMPYANYFMWALATPILAGYGRQFFSNAWKQIRHRVVGMDTLVALSTGAAYLFSVFNTLFPQYWNEKGLESHVYFEASGVIIAFILLGRLLEDGAKGKTTSAIRKLMTLQPKTVTKLTDGNEIEIPVTQVIIGDQLVVKPGEKIPVDGTVLAGNSYVDESMISGEPYPQEKKQGAQVFAGTINQKGSFTIRAQKVGRDTILSQIIQVVQKAQSSKAPVQKMVDKIARIFVPTVLGISVVTFVTWMILGGEYAFTQALLTSVTVLVIACPCALGLATPTAIMVGIGRGAENHILIKDAESLEVAHKIDTVVLDKTGTITEGKPQVSGVVWNESIDNRTELENILYAIESKSEHPVAQAIVDHLQKNAHTAVDNFESLTGNGVRAECNGLKYYVGNTELVSSQRISLPAFMEEQSIRWQKEISTVVWFACEKRVLAVFAVADRIKETSIEAIATLKNRGINICMLTGDNTNTAAAVARHTGISSFYAQTLPADKSVIVEQLQKQGKIVAMVGDGINDSQAMAQANISFAMGRGSDIAIDVAQITLMTSDLNTLPKAIALSRKTSAVIRQNLFWAFIYNLVGIPLAAGVLYPATGFLLNPMIAGAAMALSSVSVVSNSLRLKWIKLS